ncbi:hypothetical protein DK412_28340 [Methylobacterium sp. 17Sr1-1]|nr:hypothetical protein DK412_28340 [Methylobacterium sp. 17Sr1-1]
MPLARIATVAAEVNKRWWSMFTRYTGDDQYKWFDIDLATREGADLLERIAVLAALKGDAYVLDLIERAIERHTPAEDAA